MFPNLFLVESGTLEELVRTTLSLLLLEIERFFISREFFFDCCFHHREGFDFWLCSCRVFSHGFVWQARLKYQPWAYTTVECYGCNDCSYLPTNQLFFSGMTGAYQGQFLFFFGKVLKTLCQKGTNIPFVWRSYVSPNPVCAGTKAHVVSSQAVTYTFQ